jgi:DNA polymerase III alpha subunit
LLELSNRYKVPVVCLRQMLTWDSEDWEAWKVLFRVQQEYSVGDLSRATEMPSIYRAQGRFALAEKIVNDFDVLRKALKEVEGDS